MRLRDYLVDVVPKSPLYSAVRRGWIKPIAPLTLTFSVTPACQSRCLTCQIGQRFSEQPRLTQKNLSLAEIETVFSALGPIYFFNVSGGEPFMRTDLAEIIRLACLYLKPRLIHIPTNALEPETIEKTTRKILDVIDKHGPSSVSLTIKPSIDGIGEIHDKIRGISGNFAKLEQTLDRLLALKKHHPRLHVDLGTVISVYNIDHLDELETWVHNRGVDSYRHEIAENRYEFHNQADAISPTPAVYARLIGGFKDKIKKNLQHKTRLTQATESVRLVYYEVALKIIQEGRQVTPCYGGISNIHLNYDGEVWPCCVLGTDKSLGNVRLFEGDIQRLLQSEQATVSRSYISDGHCACPLANQWLNNILLHPRWMLRVLFQFLAVLIRSYKFSTDSTP
ncbi:MAG: radical SAM protein [Magnetococcales bacterium]|nr:radical SAM protein [Magnetococcales bacterium]